MKNFYDKKSMTTLSINRKMAQKKVLVFNRPQAKKIEIKQNLCGGNQHPLIFLSHFSIIIIVAFYLAIIHRRLLNNRKKERCIDPI